MNNLMILSDFLNKSGMRKTATGLYMFSALCVLRGQNMLAGAEFVDLCRWLVLALFAGNVLEHYVKSMTEKAKEDKPVAP